MTEEIDKKLKLRAEQIKAFMRHALAAQLAVDEIMKEQTQARSELREEEKKDAGV